MKKMYIYGFVVSLAIFIGVIGWFLNDSILTMFVNKAIRHHEANQKIHAQTVALDVEEYFKDIQERLKIIALFPTIKNAERGEHCNTALDAIVAVNKETFNNLGRVDKNGNFICAVNRSIVGEPIAKYGNYFEVISNDPQHQPTMSYLLSPTGSSTPVIGVHVPVFDDQGKFNGTIGGAVYFDDIEQHLLNDVKLSKNSFIVVYDNNGDILYHPDPIVRGQNINDPGILKHFAPTDTIKKFAANLKNRASGRLEYSFNEQQRIGMYEPAHVIGRSWTILVAIPTQDRKEIIEDKEVQNRLAWFFSGLCLVVFLGVVYALKPRLRWSKK